MLTAEYRLNTTSSGNGGRLHFFGAFRAMDGEIERHMDVLEASPKKCNLSPFSRIPIRINLNKYQILNQHKLKKDGNTVLF